MTMTFGLLCVAIVALLVWLLVESCTALMGGLLDEEDEDEAQ